MNSATKKQKLEYIIIYKLFCGHDRIIFRTSVDNAYTTHEDMYCASCSKVSKVNSISSSRHEIISELVNIFNTSYYTSLITPVPSLFAH